MAISRVPMSMPPRDRTVNYNALVEQLLNATFSTKVNTNGTTAVNVFGAGGAPFPLKVIGIHIIANDTTAGNISMANKTDTVFTAAKGTTAGLVTDGGTLSNVTYAAGSVCTVVSSSAGNAGVVIFYQMLEG